MIHKAVITQVQLPAREGLYQISIDDRGIITAIEPGENSHLLGQNCRIIEGGGDWISLGGVDLQINGGLGLAFNALRREHLPLLQQIAEFVWQQGIDAFLPTIVTTSRAKIQQALAVIEEFMSRQCSAGQASARVMGVHLEGPFLNYQKRGAHPAEYLLPLNLENVKQILGDYTNIVKVITLAPELERQGKVIDYLSSQRVIISLGHSLATAQEAKQAFQRGASMVTHAFNAMPSLHHREPGLLGEAIINPQVYCGLIADGQHVCPTMMQLLVKASDYDRGIFLVSDALAPIGLPEGNYPWDKRQIEVQKGTARLADGTLAGTTLPLLAGVENLVKWGICEVGEAIAMATESPRKAIGLPGIAVGQPAHFLRWHWQEKTNHLSWHKVSLSSVIVGK